MDSGAEASRVQQQEATGYERTGGAADTSGQDYEVALCSLFLLRAVRLCEEFYLASNHKLAGKFDDVVLLYRLKGDEEFSAILLQAKHKAIVSDVPLSHKSSPFRLNQYLESFNKVRKLWEEPLYVDHRLITLKNIVITLYTNTGCDIGESTCDVTDLEEVQHLQEFLNTGGRLLRIPEAQRVGLAQGPDTSDFLGHVLVCTRQMSSNTADQFLKEELCKLLSLASPDIDGTLCSELKSVMKVWWGEKGRGRYLTADSEELNRVLDLQVRRLNRLTDSQIKLGFTVAALQELDVAGRRMKMTWIPVRDEYQASVTKARLLRAQSKSLVLDATFVEIHWNEVGAVWGKSVCPILALSLEARGSQLLQRLQVALQGDAARQLVVVATEQPPGEGWDVVTLQPTWSALDSDTRGRLLSARVQLQGAAVVQLRDIVGCSEGDVMTDEVILSVGESTIRLGDKMGASLNYYVPRCLRRTSYKNINLQSLENTNTLIFQDESYKSDDSYNGRVKTLELSDLSAIGKVEGLTLIRSKTLDSAIRNVCCKFGVQGIRGEVRSKGLTGEVTQFIPFTWICEDKVVLVEGVPGVGKSSFVAAMCSSAKAQFPDAWVLRVDMGKHCDYLEGASFRSRSDVIDFLLRDLRRLERRLLEHALTATGNVFLFLDAFDEISPDFTARCCDLVKAIAHDVRYRQMVVTTRPVTTKDVQQALHAEAFTLPAFSEQEQKLFFSQYYVARQGKIFQSQITSLRRSLGSVIEVPLLCKMVADVMLDRQDQSLLKYKDPWRRVLLYKVFVEQKLQLAVVEKASLETSNPVVLKVLQSIKKQHIRNLQALAVRKLMPVKELTDLCDSTETPEEKLGLVVDTGEAVDFEHRTYAEFFLGRWLRDNWHQCPRQLLRDLLLQDGFQFVAATLSWSLLEGFPLHEAVARGDEASVRALLVPEITDRGGRTPLHVAAMTVDCSREVCRLLVDAGGKLDRQDEVLNTTAVRYAEVETNWDFVDLMQVKGAALVGLNFLTDADATMEVLLYALRKDLDSLVKYILKFNEKLLHRIVDDDRNTLLHIAAGNNSRRVIKLLLHMKHEVNVINVTGLTPLNTASRSGHVEAVWLLVNNGADANVEDRVGQTPLMWATTTGNLKVVKLLIQGGAKINMKDTYGDNALTRAASDGKVEIVKLLIDSGSERDTKGVDGNSPLMLAAKKGHIEVVQLLLESGVLTNIRNKNGDTAMTLATREGHQEVVRLLKQKDTETYIKTLNGNTDMMLTVLEGNLEATKLLIESSVDTNKVNENGGTALTWVGRDGHVDVVKYLLESGVDTNIVDSYGDTALMLAAFKSHVDVVKLLIESGVEADIRDNYGITALTLAALKGHVDVVKLLIESAVDTNIRDNYCNTALTLAVMGGHVDVVKLLIESGVETNIRNDNCNTTLTLAAFKGHVDVVKLLIESGVDTNIRNNDGDTALTLAAMGGHVDIVKLLTESGVDTNIRNNDGHTTLMLAAMGCHVDVVKLLIESGVETDIRDNYGNTTLTLAAMGGHVDVVKFLIDYGVETNIRNYNSDTALTLAAFKGHVDVVKLLIESGVETTIRNDNGYTALMLAAFKGHVDVVKLLIESGVDTNIVDSYGNTALTLAAFKDHVDVVKLLIESGVDTNIRNNDGDTALTLAAVGGHVDIVKLLIESGVETNIRNNYGVTALTLAAQGGHVDVVKLLIESGVDTNITIYKRETALTLTSFRGHVDIVKLLIESGVDTNIKNDYGNTALMAAAIGGQVDVVKLLIESGVESNIRNDNGNTALMLAAMRGHVPVVNLLIESGVDTNIKDNDGYTALKLAAMGGHMDVVKLLIESGVDTNIRNDYGDTALTLAAFKGHVDVVKLLIESGVETNIRNDNGYTALMLAAMGCHVDVVKLLIESGVETNIVDSCGDTALMLATFKGHVDVVKLLIESGVETNIRNDNCNTTLTLAAFKGHVDIVKLLIESGVETNIRDNDGNTALKLAAMGGHVDVVKLLIESGVETNIRNDYGDTALTLAAVGGHVAVVKLLIESGVDTNITNNDGNTALSLAGCLGHMDVVKLLIENGLEVNEIKGNVDSRMDEERRGLLSRLWSLLCRFFRS